MNSLGFALIKLLEVLQFAILIRVIISWFPISRENVLVKLLYQITEPILAPIRALLERSSFGKNAMLDLSPIIAILIIYLLAGFIQRILGFGVSVF